MSTVLQQFDITHQVVPRKDHGVTLITTQSCGHAYSSFYGSEFDAEKNAERVKKLKCFDCTNAELRKLATPQRHPVYSRSVSNNGADKFFSHPRLGIRQEGVALPVVEGKRVTLPGEVFDESTLGGLLSKESLDRLHADPAFREIIKRPITAVADLSDDKVGGQNGPNADGTWTNMMHTTRADVGLPPVPSGLEVRDIYVGGAEGVAHDVTVTVSEGKTPPPERLLFTLDANDKTAASTIAYWISQNVLAMGTMHPKIQSAQRELEKFRAWPTKKQAD